jgi:hypothetical protein
MNLIPKSRDEARILGSIFYCTDVACKNGHIDKRYTNTGICYACKRSRNSRDYRAHRQRAIATNKKSNKKNWKRILTASREWVRKNIEKSRAIKKAWKVRNREKYLSAARAYATRKNTNPFYRLSSRFSKSVWAFMKGAKGGRKWESLVGYSHKDLYDHLDKQLSGEMSWDNYGEYWHVDHIIPKVFFDKLDISSEEKLRICFSLVNLRPCVKYGDDGNLSKNAKMIPELVAPVFKALGLETYSFRDKLHGSGDTR